MPQWSSICFFSLCVLVCWGCGHEGAPPVGISGTVTFEGKPVTQGIVLFMSDQGFGASAELDSQGHYAVRSQYGKGIPAGKYRVTVTPLSEAVNESDAPSAPPQSTPHPEIPQKYRDFSTSGLEITLSGKPEVFDIQFP